MRVSIAARRLPSWFELSIRRNSSTAVSIGSGCSARSRMRVRMAQQQIDAVADQVGGGLVAGVEQEDAIVQKLRLGQPVAACRCPRRSRWRRSGSREFRRCRWCRLALAARHEIAQIILEFGDGGDAAVELLAGDSTGSSAPRIASDQSRNGPRSACGMPSMSPISCTGIAAAKSSIRSIVPRSAAASSRRSTSASMRGCIARKRARRERRRQQLADAGVDRRIVEHQAGGVVLVEQAVAEVRPELDCLVRAPGLAYRDRPRPDRRSG